jgi:DNA-directed RNA polymerase subunit RPC12/RpoP
MKYVCCYICKEKTDVSIEEKKTNGYKRIACPKCSAMMIDKIFNHVEMDRKTKKETGTFGPAKSETPGPAS